MACFIVPAAEAVVTTVTKKIIEKKEGGSEHAGMFSSKLGMLGNMLWGGSALLAFEHVWHGEVVPFFPFLTAAGSAAETSAMLQEMATVGPGMAAAVTLAWAGAVIAGEKIKAAHTRKEGAKK